MTRAASTPLLRLLPSLTDVAFLMPLAFLFSRMDGVKTLLGDGDTGWHIRTGEWILANARVPAQDIFSYTREGQPWFAWEWLWDALFAKVHQLTGLAGVVLASACLIALTFALLYRLVCRKCGNALIAIAVTSLAALGSAIHFLARPHLFTWLLLVIFYAVLERVREAQFASEPGKSRLLFALPALMVLWTNLHGAFFVGIVLIAAYAVGELAGALAAGEPGRRAAAIARSKPYLAAAAACIAASFVNPYSYRLHLHILEYLRDPFQFQRINEFLTISFQHPVARFFEPMLLLGAVAAFWHLSRMRLGYVLLLGLWMHLGLMSARNIPLYLIVAAPLVAQTLQEMLVRLREADVAAWLRRAARAFENLGTETAATDHVARAHLLSAAAMLGLALIVLAPNPPEKFRAEYDPKTYPAKALPFLSTGSGRIFSNDEWGDYLIYRLYPQTKVFIDGRSDFYGAQFGEKVLDTLNVKPDWEENLRRYAVDTVLLPATSALSGALKQSQRWRVAYDDGVAIVFRPAARPGGEQVSAVHRNGGAGRDRKITKSATRDLAITQSTT